MAKVLVAGRLAIYGPLGQYLRETLADDYYAVVDPVVCACPLDAVVIGPKGVTALKVREPAGIRHAGRGNGHTNDKSPEVQAAAAEKALALFLRDEFPALTVPITFLRIARGPAGTDAWTIVEPVAMTDTDLAHAILELPGQPQAPLADDEAREALALGLRDRQLTATQRATRPFVFRSAGALGVTAKAWTIRDAVAHMDRHPEDGIYHLRNDTLAEWLESEGALSLAQLARSVVRGSRTDPRASLETFLIGTGQVSRPRLSLRPRRVDMGYAIAGEAMLGTLRLAKGRGRGYLFGDIVPGEPWLDSEPRAFSGGQVHITLRADTAALPIGDTPHEADLLLDCSAAERPVAVPVRIRVVALPSPVMRHIFRPLALAILAGALGALVGAALGRWAGPLPGLAAGWLPAVALLWALTGFLGGLRQPPAYPWRYTATRWLGWLLGWCIIMPGFVLAVTWLWGRGDPSGAFTVAPEARTIAWLLALACAVVPATIAEVSALRSRVVRAGEPVRSGWRRLLVPALAGLVLLALLGALPLARPAWQRQDVQGAWATVQSWSQDAGTRLNRAAGQLMDQFYLRYYDRRAPVTSASQPAAADQPDAGAAGR